MDLTWKDFCMNLRNCFTFFKCCFKPVDSILLNITSQNDYKYENETLLGGWECLCLPYRLISWKNTLYIYFQWNTKTGCKYVGRFHISHWIRPAEAWEKLRATEGTASRLSIKTFRSSFVFLRAWTWGLSRFQALIIFLWRAPWSIVRSHFVDVVDRDDILGHFLIVGHAGMFEPVTPQDLARQVRCSRLKNDQIQGFFLPSAKGWSNNYKALNWVNFTSTGHFMFTQLVRQMWTKLPGMDSMEGAYVEHVYRDCPLSSSTIVNLFVCEENTKVREYSTQWDFWSFLVHFPSVTWIVLPVSGVIPSMVRMISNWVLDEMSLADIS